MERQEKWAERSLMESGQETCEALPLERNSARPEYMLGDN